VEFKDYYQILGVGKRATPDEIKTAYRKLARQHHPDISKEACAAQRMAEINEAHTVLGDAAKRAAYDRVGAQAWAAGARSGDDVRPPHGWNAGFGFGGGAPHGFHASFGGGDAGQFSEFFEQMFGHAGAASRVRPRPGQPHAAQRGEDRHARIELDLLDAYRGTERVITLNGAQGRVTPQERTLQMKIPQGVKAGQTIRLGGQGNPGCNGGAAGDLLLEVHFRPDPRWRVDGRDVTQKLRITPWEAALGRSVPVITPDGNSVEVAVPAGSGPGRKLRLKGRGIPFRSTPGDLYLELDIVVPGAVTPEQQTAWQTLAGAYLDFDPRR
jgi:curved DNA-binding protein